MVDSPVALRHMLRRIAEWPATNEPMLSAYLDLRPHSTDNPNVRTGLVVLRDRLREFERADKAPPAKFLARLGERIEREIDARMPDLHGLAIFAAADDLLEVAETRVALDNDVRLGARPHLLPLARLADAQQAVVALADTSTLRIFVHRSGALEEMGLLDDDTEDYRQTQQGGWSQAGFQRHVEAHRDAFAQLAAEQIEEIVNLEDAELLLLAGDEVAVPPLREQLSQPVAQKVRGTLRLEMRSTLQEVEAEAFPVLERLRAEDAEDTADRLVGTALGDGMAITGREETREALVNGQALEVVVDAGIGPDEEAELNELIALAVMTAARVRFAKDHGALREMGGVGALLRFRVDRPRTEPVGAGGPTR